MLSRIPREEDDESPEDGATLGQRYRIVTRIGTGGFGTVYRAEDPVLGDVVALKILDRRWCSIPDVRERFIEEARRQRLLPTSRVVGVRDLIEEGGRPVVVMENMTGGSLRDQLQQGGLLDLGDARRLVLGLAADLRMLGAAGVVHRDLSPANLLLRTSSSGAAHRRPRLHGCELVLADLGLTRRASAERLALPSGTAGFRAPEQERIGVELTPQADFYAATQIVVTAVLGAPLVRTIVPGELSAAARSTLRRYLDVDPRRRPADVEQWTGGMLDLVPQLMPDDDRAWAPRLVNL